MPEPITPESVVRGYLDSLGKGNVAAILSFFGEDAIIDMPGPSSLPFAGQWVGREKIEEYFRIMPAAVKVGTLEYKHWVADGEKIVVTGVETSGSRVSGKDYSAKFCWVFHVSNGKIALWDAYEDTDTIIQAGPWRL